MIDDSVAILQPHLTSICTVRLKKKVVNVRVRSVHSLTHKPMNWTLASWEVEILFTLQFVACSLEKIFIGSFQNLHLLLGTVESVWFFQSPFPLQWPRSGAPGWLLEGHLCRGRWEENVSPPAWTVFSSQPVTKLVPLHPGNTMVRMKQGITGNCNGWRK